MYQTLLMLYLDFKLTTRGQDHLSSQAEAEDCGSCIIGAHPSPSLPLANLCDN